MAGPSGRAVHQIAAQGFQLQAGAYERARPGYAPQVLDYLVRLMGLSQPKPGGSRWRVLDLAAGTGKWTRMLAQLPHVEVVAAEPSAGMREGFRRQLPGIPMVDATASQLPFADGEFDAVFVAQAFHWFADEASLQEVHRVLRPPDPSQPQPQPGTPQGPATAAEGGSSGPCAPGGLAGGGWLALLWNMEDGRRSAWVAQLRALYEQYDGSIPQYRTGRWRSVFCADLAARMFEPPPEAEAEAAAAEAAEAEWAQAGGASGEAGGPSTSSRPGACSGPGGLGEWAKSDRVLCTRMFDCPGDPVTRGLVWQRILSKSYIATLSAEVQERLKAEVEAVLQGHDAEFKHCPGTGAGQALTEHHSGSTGAGSQSEAEPMAMLPICTEVAVCRRRA